MSAIQPFDKKPCRLEEEGVTLEVLQVLKVSVKCRHSYLINETPDEVIEKFAGIGYICLGTTGSTTTRVWTFSKDEEYNICDEAVNTELSSDELLVLPSTKKSISKPSTSKLTVDAKVTPLPLPSIELGDSSHIKTTKSKKKSKCVPKNRLKVSFGNFKKSGKRRTKSKAQSTTKR